ncbi:hypothetical protein [Chitinibacter sp. S2-10]|uniref:hypothetical protein n=1 Tax=Chitinibacter sp. S2-10 TaxID=3373597 RepID=UPI0039776910
MKQHQLAYRSQTMDLSAIYPTLIAIYQLALALKYARTAPIKCGAFLSFAIALLPFCFQADTFHINWKYLLLFSFGWILAGLILLHKNKNQAAKDSADS